jgi:hypothetical protein
MNVRTMACALGAATLLAGCASTPSDEPAGAPRAQTVVAVTADGALITFNAGTPRQIDARHPVTGLAAGERLVGIDYRVARGVLYGLGSAGRLYTLDATTGVATPVGSAPSAPLAGSRFGFDFNPAADRIRVVSDGGQNLRLHPDTGALAVTDPSLTTSATGVPATNIVGAAYTYNKLDEKLTTNYALDIGRGWLLTQGTVEGRTPAVSPNTGRLYDVGALGTGPADDAHFDIADLDNAALAALHQGGRTRLHLIDLATGRASLLGTVGDGRPLAGIAIVP